MKKYSPKEFWDKSINFNVINRSSLSTPEDLALAELNMNLLVGKINNPEERYRQAIKNACNDSNPEKKEDFDKYHRWKYILEKLS